MIARLIKWLARRLKVETTERRVSRLEYEMDIIAPIVARLHKSITGKPMRRDQIERIRSENRNPQRHHDLRGVHRDS